MKKHLETVSPTLGVLTTIAEEHLEKLKDLKTVAQEELEALHWLNQRKLPIFLNLDDPLINQDLKTLSQNDSQVVTFSLEKTATLQGKYDLKKSTLTLQGMGVKNHSFPIPLKGSHHARNLLSAIAIALFLKVSPDQIQSLLKTFHPSRGRTEFQSWQGHQLFCDYYNASPASTEAALRLMSELTSSIEKTWICLGDMLELGPNELEYHRALSQPLNQYQFKNILLYGPRMKSLWEKLKTKSEHIKHFETHEALAHYLKTHLQPQSWILLKGSRGMKMEKILEHLK